MKKNLLFIAHAPSQNTQKLASICYQQMKACSQDVNIIQKAPLNTQSSDILNCAGLLIGTTENIGYMAGLTKDMFDRVYNDCLYHTDGLAVGFYIRAGLDGTATANVLSRFAQSLRWRMIRPPVIFKGDYQPTFEDEVGAFGGAFAAGLETGIF
jgi:multimeric flavodoxin WrbA